MAEPIATSLVACPLCGAATGSAPGDIAAHHAFHVAHDLHGPGCVTIAIANAERNFGTALTPQPCNCGLVLTLDVRPGTEPVSALGMVEALDDAGQGGLTAAVGNEPWTDPEFLASEAQRDVDALLRPVRAVLDEVWRESQGDFIAIRDAGVMQDIVTRVRVALGDEEPQ